MSKENTIEEILESTKDIKKVDLNPYIFNKILLKIKLNKDVFLPTNLIWLSLCTFILLIFCNLVMIIKIDKIIFVLLDENGKPKAHNKKNK
jgi:hypothetical protein